MTDIRTYRGLYLVNVPQADGEPLPCAIANTFARFDEYQVICLDPERYNDWLLNVPRGIVKPFTGELTPQQKQQIDKRMH